MQMRVNKKNATFIRVHRKTISIFENAWCVKFPKHPNDELSYISTAFMTSEVYHLKGFAAQ